MVWTVIGAVPLRVTRLELLVMELVVRVKFAATVASWETRNVRRSLNHCFTALGAARGWPSQNWMPFASNELYFASISALQSARTNGPLTASCTARKKARRKGGWLYMVVMFGSSQGVKSGA